MCGIAAIVKTETSGCPTEVLERMTDEVAHRGPDDSGSVLFRRCGTAWLATGDSDSAWQVGLGHRRLSILDISSAGHQPMTYGAHLWIIYNGEVYNFVELRAELEHLGHAFRSASDTEVILAAYDEWGPACFARLRGMWGLAILDTLRGEMVLCRDRMGIKPLYLWSSSQIVAVASEIKQFRHLPGFAARLNLSAGWEYLQTGYEDAERTFFRDVRPVPAGTSLSISLDTLQVSEPQPYWHPEGVRVVVTRAEEAGRAFVAKLQESVRLHLRSDVPVGCALSGGLDSGSIAIMMDRLRADDSAPLHTFTLTFPGDPMDERGYVDAVLAATTARPHFVTPAPDNLLAEFDRFLWTHDEPVGSISVYAAYCVARLAREHGVPVALNGQGGDEVLSGYWQTYFTHLRSLLHQGQALAVASHMVGAAVAGDGNPEMLAQSAVMLRRYRARRRPRTLTLGGTLQKNGDGASILDRVLAMDEQSRRLYELRKLFLPRLLKWDDRNSMAFSVEGRYPFLDHELIELCLSFSPSVLFRRGWTKWPLRLGLRSVLPDRLLRRRTKFGFEVPQDKWLRGALRPMLEAWLGADRPLWNLIERGQVRQLARRTWQAKSKGEERGQALFRLFAFDRWMELFDVAA